MILIDIFILFLSLVCYFCSDFLPLEMSYILIIPYIILIINSTRKNRWGFILPPFIFTLTMILFVWISAILVKYDFSDLILFTYGKIDESTLNKCVYLGLIAVSTNWISFNFFYDMVGLKNRIANYAFDNITEITPKAKYIFGVLILIMSYFIITGSFGYFADKEKEGLVNFTDKFFKLALCIPVYYFISSGKIELFNKSKMFYSYSLLILALIGAASGSKSLIALPFFYLVFVNYLHTDKLISKYILYFFIILIVAFIIIIPIRYVLENKSKTSELSQTEVNALINNDNKGVIVTTAIVMVDRINYVPVLSKAINYKGFLPPSVTNLWWYTFSSPLYAIFPRFIFPNKPVNDFTKWYAYNICNSTEDNNMSATYQGILYMNGGVISVIGGFLLVGLFQFLFVLIFFRPQYLYIYIILLLTIAVLPAEPWAYFTGYIQDSIIFFMFHKLILNKP